MVIGLLSTLPYSKKLPPSKVVMTAGFAANHPLIPFNTALQYGIVLAVLGSAGVAANVRWQSSPSSTCFCPWAFCLTA